MNPKEVIKQKIIIPTDNTQIQQVGVDLTLRNSIELEPHSFINTELAEQFNMKDYFGFLVIRSSYSRKGIFISSGVYDPGFKGVGGISLYNMSDETIKIDAGTRICQIIVFKANSASDYDGHYNHNNSIESKH